MTSAFFRFRHLAANKTWHGVVENTLKARASHMYPVTFEHLKGVLLQAPQCSAEPSTYEIATAIWSNEQIVCNVGAQLGSLPEGGSRQARWTFVANPEELSVVPNHL